MVVWKVRLVTHFSLKTHVHIHTTSWSTTLSGITISVSSQIYLTIIEFSTIKHQFTNWEFSIKSFVGIISHSEYWVSPSNHHFQSKSHWGNSIVSQSSNSHVEIIFSQSLNVMLYILSTFKHELSNSVQKSLAILVSTFEAHTWSQNASLSTSWREFGSRLIDEKLFLSKAYAQIVNKFGGKVTSDSSLPANAIYPMLVTEFGMVTLVIFMSLNDEAQMLVVPPGMLIDVCVHA